MRNRPIAVATRSGSSMATSAASELTVAASCSSWPRAQARVRAGRLLMIRPLLFKGLEAWIVRIDRRNAASFLGHLRRRRGALFDGALLFQVQVDRVDQFLAAFAVQGRDLEDRAFPAHLLDEVLDPLLAFFFRHHV